MDSSNEDSGAPTRSTQGQLYDDELDRCHRVQLSQIKARVI
jgi:hypothetical protein